MEAANLFKNRRSIRQFSDKPIEDNVLHQILVAAMSGPSCINSKDWCFVVVRNKQTLMAMAEVNGRAAAPLISADVGILVCGDLSRTNKNAPDYWIIDGSIACQNIVLSATAHNVGSVWLGTYPQSAKVDGQKKLFNLPDNVMPHSIIALGYAENSDEMKLGSRSGYEDSQVHFEKW